jgi:hypothetical protein
VRVVLKKLTQPMACRSLDDMSDALLGGLLVKRAEVLFAMFDCEERSETLSHLPVAPW